jgi:predicted phage terminase large subunit-like protein
MTDALLSRQIPTYTAIQAELLRRDFREFIRAAWPHVESKPFTPGWHIDAIAEHFCWVMMGEIDQLMINIPPRFSKTTSVSVMGPAWAWTSPEWAGIQWLCTSYASNLSIRDTVASRRLILSPWYQERWGGIFRLSYDENTKSRFSNDQGGYRIATSVDGSGTGEGGDIQIGDDFHNMKEIYSDAKRQGAVDYYKNTFRSRVNNPDRPRRIFVMQRGHDNDVPGHIWATEREHWTWLVLPQEYDPTRKSVTVIKGKKRWEDPRTKEGELLCPARMSQRAVEYEKKHGMTRRDFQAQHNQDPSAGGGLILKREWWKVWPKEKPPPVIQLVSFWDTAFEAKEEADHSARTTWGVFEHSETGDDKDNDLNIILINAWWDQVNYPDLKEEIKATHERFEEDMIVIEKKASGISLIQDLRRDSAKYPVKEFNPRADKVMRAHLASFPLEKGKVWVLDRPALKNVQNMCAKFPALDMKDVVDTVTMALIWFRKKHMVLAEDLYEDRDELTDRDTKRRKPTYG